MTGEGTEGFAARAASNWIRVSLQRLTAGSLARLPPPPLFFSPPSRPLRAKTSQRGARPRIEKKRADGRSRRSTRAEGGRRVKKRTEGGGREEKRMNERSELPPGARLLPAKPVSWTNMDSTSLAPRLVQVVLLPRGQARVCTRPACASHLALAARLSSPPSPSFKAVSWQGFCRLFPVLRLKSSHPSKEGRVGWQTGRALICPNTAVLGAGHTAGKVRRRSRCRGGKVHHLAKMFPISPFFKQRVKCSKDAFRDFCRIFSRSDR